MTTRETILRSWWAARRSADVSGAIIMTAPTFAGYALEAADGDVGAALKLVPTTPPAFMSRVSSHLSAVHAEEKVAPALRAAAVGGR